jgi:hypothetical protein
MKKLRKYSLYLQICLIVAAFVSLFVGMFVLLPLYFDSQAQMRYEIHGEILNTNPDRQDLHIPPQVVLQVTESTWKHAQIGQTIIAETTEQALAQLTIGNDTLLECRYDPSWSKYYCIPLER